MICITGKSTLDIQTANLTLCGAQGLCPAVVIDVMTTQVD